MSLLKDYSENGTKVKTNETQLERRAQLAEIKSIVLLYNIMQVILEILQ